MMLNIKTYRCIYRRHGNFSNPQHRKNQSITRIIYKMAFAYTLIMFKHESIDGFYICRTELCNKNKHATNENAKANMPQRL